MARTTATSTNITNRNSSSAADGQGAHELTELEGAALGIIWEKGECSAYAVMREFSTSRSSTWSASAGAVYPALRRLEKMGFISAVGGERKRALVLSSAGLQALRAWVSVQPEMARVTGDPIRTRMFFLSALPSDAQRMQFIDAAEAATRHALQELTESIDQLANEDIAKLASLGSAFQLKARQRWLRLVRRNIGRRQ